jgi:hypothetical protein
LWHLAISPTRPQEAVDWRETPWVWNWVSICQGKMHHTS